MARRIKKSENPIGLTVFHKKVMLPLGEVIGTFKTSIGQVLLSVKGLNGVDWPFSPFIENVRVTTR